MNIGFIGLGAMGKGMAANLIKAGHEVRVWNRNAGAADALIVQGATSVATPAQAFEGDALISMLADDAAVREIFVDSGLLARAPKHTIHINMATISVEFAKQLAVLHREVGVPYIAAPVFGRSDMAAAGKLNIIAAGADELLDRVQPLFDVMGQKTWRVGNEVERANVIKLAGNFMIISAIESLAEAMTLVKGYGVSESALLDVLTGSILPVPLFKNYGALIANRQFEPAAFRLNLGLKDVRLALAAGEQANVPLPVASLLRDNLVDSVAHGDGDKDLAALSQVAFRRARQ